MKSKKREPLQKLSLATRLLLAIAYAHAGMTAGHAQDNTPETSKTALLHDTRTAKALLDKFCTLAQTRLLGIIAHRQQKIKEQTTGNASTPTLEGDQRTAQRVNRHPPPQPPRQPTTAIT